jgi:hypothetical protein
MAVIGKLESVARGCDAGVMARPSMASKGALLMEVADLSEEEGMLPATLHVTLGVMVSFDVVVPLKVLSIIPWTPI